MPTNLLAPLLELGPLLGHFDYAEKNEIRFHNGCHYEGDLEFGEMHGTGSFKWPSGISYEGEFRRNRIEGLGKMTWSEDAWYQGEFRENVRHGQGKLSFSNGITYDGEWDRGKPHGKGTMTWSSTHYYSGEFNNGLRHGRGEMHYASGSVYIGEWNNGIRHGKGRMTWISGDTYEGNWEMGQINGVGQYIWPKLRSKEFYSSINEYEGEFQNGQRHGQGIFRYADGSHYKGNFIENRKESGSGEFKDFTGHIHIGKFTQDQMKSRQYITGIPNWGVTQPSLQVQLRRHFRILFQHFRMYKQCFPYESISSLTRDQFWYLLLPFRKAKVKLYQLDSQLTKSLDVCTSSPSDPIQFHVYLKFMLKFPEHWKLLKPPQSNFATLYAHGRKLVHQIYQKFPNVTLHRLVVWLYHFNPTNDLSVCIRSVAQGIPWLIQYQTVFLEYPVVCLEFFESAFYFFARNLDLNSDASSSLIQQELENFFFWILNLDE